MVRFAYMRLCGTCNEPIDIFDMCEYLGFNPGVDGHLFVSKEKAKRAWENFEKLAYKYGKPIDVDVRLFRLDYSEVK